MKSVCVSETKEDFISTIKGDKIYHIMETYHLWSERIYNAVHSEMRPDIVDTVVLPGGYGWTSKPDKEIYRELKEVLVAKGYELTFKAAGAE